MAFGKHVSVTSSIRRMNIISRDCAMFFMYFKITEAKIMEAFKEILAVNIPASVATIGLVLYFFGMAVVFITNPIKNAESFSVKPVDNAGKTEIRVYYGGISFALGAFLLYLTLALKTPFYSMVGGLFFATTVFVTRSIFLCVDKGWKCPYTKLAIPAEGLFVIALWTCFVLSETMY